MSQIYSSQHRAAIETAVKLHAPDEHPPPTYAVKHRFGWLPVYEVDGLFYACYNGRLFGHNRPETMERMIRKGSAIRLTEGGTHPFAYYLEG